MIDQRFVIVGALISFGGVMVYIGDTLRGRTQPNRVTWLLWALAPMLAFAAELNAHVGLSSLMTFSVGFNPLLVLAASFVNPKASWHIGPFDYVCGALSIFGTIAWLLTRSTNIALVAAIAADALAALPTVRKAIVSPRSESRIVFFGGIVNATITLLVVRRHDAAHIAFPLYILMINLALTVILRPRRVPGPDGQAGRPARYAGQDPAAEMSGACTRPRGSHRKPTT